MSSVILEPVDAAERATAACNTFPCHFVQLEGDYFYMNKIDAAWVIGHAGVSDYHHKYWPLVYQITKSENERHATSLFQQAVALINACMSGAVRTILADGGTALNAAITKLPGNIVRRRCFTHNTCMGNTRSGSKRGGKGLLPRYLLDNKVPPKIMAKLLAVIFMFNYLPALATYQHAMLLLLDEYGTYLNEHVRTHYLNVDTPHNLGGRVV